MMKNIRNLLFVSTLVWFSNISAETYEVSSGPQKNALLELYTSQGCSSCPPADEWHAEVSKQKAFAEQGLIPLAFHVDYWDYLGWKDPFANADYSMRQKMHQIQGAINALYTPQLILNSSELRPVSRLPTMFDSVKNTAAVVNLTLRLDTEDESSGLWDVQLTSTPFEEILASKQSVYFAVTESNLRTAVLAGENHGRSLLYNNVVRELIGPISISLDDEMVIERKIKLDTDWRKENLNLVAFVQSERGDIMQAISLRATDTNLAK